jgi:hypothetical protein
MKTTKRAVGLMYLYKGGVSLLIPGLVFVIIPSIEILAQEQVDEPLKIELHLEEGGNVLSDAKSFDVTNYTFSFAGLDNDNRNYVLEEGDVDIYAKTVRPSGTLNVENKTADPNIKETLILPFSGFFNVDGIRENIVTNQTQYLLSDGSVRMGDKLSWSDSTATLVLQPSGGNNDKMKGVMTIESAEQSTELEELGDSR